MIRKEVLANESYYHIYSRSIAKYIVFNNDEEFSRILEILNLYRYANFNYKYSKYKNLDPATQKEVEKNLLKDSDFLVEIVAYCIMPTHFHLILKQSSSCGISKYIAKVLNSYSKYFNTKHQRTGPLWASRFKSVLVDKDEQLLHLTRYIHLNPASAGLVKNPRDWLYSSYLEYIDKEYQNRICSFSALFDLSEKEYEKFVLDRKSYQQQLSQIKSLIVDDYTG